MVTSPREAPQREGERRPDGGVQEDGLEGEEKDLPIQPPPVAERPKESKDSQDKQIFTISLISINHSTFWGSFSRFYRI